MDEFPANGRKVGFSSWYWPVESACRVDQASKVAAPCWTMLRTSHLRRGILPERVCNPGVDRNEAAVGGPFVVTAPTATLPGLPLAVRAEPPGPAGPVIPTSKFLRS